MMSSDAFFLQGYFFVRNFETLSMKIHLGHEATAYFEGWLTGKEPELK